MVVEWFRAARWQPLRSLDVKGSHLRCGLHLPFDTALVEPVAAALMRHDHGANLGWIPIMLLSPRIAIGWQDRDLIHASYTAREPTRSSGSHSQTHARKPQSPLNAVFSCFYINEKYYQADRRHCQNALFQSPFYILWQRILISALLLLLFSHSGLPRRPLVQCTVIRRHHGGSQ